MEPRRRFCLTTIAVTVAGLVSVACEDAALTGPVVRDWVSSTSKDFGEQPTGAKLVGEFPLRNPTDADQWITKIESSCTCQKVVVWIDDRKHEVRHGDAPQPIAVPKGAKGRLEAHIEVPERQGPLPTEVRVDTSDKSCPSFLLAMTTIAVPEFIVEQGGKRSISVDLGEVAGAVTRKFEFTVRSRDEKPFVVDRWHGVPPGFHIEANADGSDGAVWKIRGTVGPDLDERTVGGTIQFDTDRKAGFQIRVHLLVKPPFEVKPSFLSYGFVPAQEGAARDIMLVSAGAGVKLSVKAVEVFDVWPRGAAVTAAVRLQTAKWVNVRVTLPKGLPKGLVTGKVRIRFAGDELPARVVGFRASVR